VIMAGATRPEVIALVAGDSLLFEPLGRGTAQVLAPQLPGADPATAAFVNGTAGTFLELDEGYRPTGHPAVHVLPAALAAAQSLHRSGVELVEAFLAGYEVSARLFESYQLTYPLHPHGHLGAIGAAVAVARLRRAEAGEPALIAATLPLLSTWQACYEGATARNAYAGTAAAMGILANRLAAAGFTGSAKSFGVAFGEMVGRLVNAEPLDEPIDVGELRLARDYLKFHSACALSHSALDAVLELGPMDPGDVVRIEVETVANNQKIARQAADNDLSTRFSLPYAVAAAIVHGHTGPEAFIPDRRTAELARRVEVRVAADLEASWPLKAPARVIVQTRQGTRTRQVDNPRGHFSNPADANSLRMKFERLTWLKPPGPLYDRLLEIDSLADCAQLFDGLA